MTSRNIYIQYLEDKIKSKNKYFHIYENMIKELMRRNQEDILMGENHHIYPVCFCNDNKKYLNDENNIVRLTYREHFIAHRLLSKLDYIDKSDYISVLFAVSCFMQNKKKRNLTSRQFQIAKESVVLAMKNRVVKDETKEKLSKNRKGKSNFYDLEGNVYFLDIDDPLIVENNLFGNRKHYTTVKNKNGIITSAHKDDPRFETGEICGIMKGKSTYISDSGMKLTLFVDDPIIDELNLKHVNFGRKFSMPEGHSKGKKNPMSGRKNEVCCFDLIEKKFLRIDKETFDNNKRYVGVNNKIAKEYRNKKE